MQHNYTQAAQERCLGLIHCEIDTIWEKLGIPQEQEDLARWQQTLKAIAAEYNLSARFALMRILQAQLVAEEAIAAQPNIGFTVETTQHGSVSFSDISMAHAQSLSPEELAQYAAVLAERAALQSNAHAKRDMALIRKALQINPTRKKDMRLTREEAFQLGHCLQWTLDEMDWFLCRVFNAEGGGFSYNTSNDLIEAYGFLVGASAAKVHDLKRGYAALYAELPKHTAEEKAADWTLDMGESLPEQVKCWMAEPHNRSADAQFMQWMRTQAPNLDLPSHTALRIYRNLAAFAYGLVTQQIDAPETDRKQTNKHAAFYDAICGIAFETQYTAQAQAALFAHGTIQEERCMQVVTSLLRENWCYTFSEQADRSKAWHVVDALPNGSLTVNGGINASRTRVLDLLMGRVPHITKSDLLYLLWFTANICWFQTDWCPEDDDVRTRFMDFIDAAECLLDAALLPPFYPPHPIEQSMMRSIVHAYAAGEEKTEPAIVYETLCSAVH